MSFFNEVVTWFYGFYQYVANILFGAGDNHQLESIESSDNENTGTSSTSTTRKSVASKSKVAQNTREKSPKNLKALKKKREAEEAALKKKQAEEAALKKKQAEEVALKKKQAEEVALKKKQAEEAALKKKQAEEAALKKKQAEEAALKKKQAEEAALKKKQAEEAALKKKQAEEAALKKKQAEEAALKKKQAEEAALKKKQAEEATLKKKEAEEAALKKKEAEEAALKKKEAEEAALKKKEAEEAALKKKEAEEAALKKKEAEEAALKKKEAEEAALKKKEAEEAALKKKEAEEAALKKKEAEEAALKKKEAEEAALKKKEAEEAALKKKQAEEAALKKKQAEEAALKKKQAEEAALKKKQAEEAALKKKQAEEAALKKKQAEEAALKKKQAEEAALKKKQAEEAALKKKQAEEAALKKKEAEKAALKKKEDEEAALKKKQAEEAALKKKEAEEAALKKKEAEKAALKKKEDEEAALKKKEDEEAALRIKEAVEAQIQQPAEVEVPALGSDDESGLGSGDESGIIESIEQEEIVEKELKQELQETSKIETKENSLVELKQPIKLQTTESVQKNEDPLSIEDIQAVKTEKTNFTLTEMDPTLNGHQTMNVLDENQQVRVLSLENNQNYESKLFRIEKGWIVQFRRGPSLFGKNINLFSNYPADDSSFVRESFRELRWSSDSQNTSDDTSLYTQIEFKLAGSFKYYFTYSGSNAEVGCGYFVVDPTLRVGNDNTTLPLDCVQSQTVLSKNLGAFPGWKDKLRVAKETGYNVIHFSPIQTLGGSNSAYSLLDQFGVNTTFHPEGGKCSMEDIGALVNEMKEEWGVLSLVDVVLNHTANESPWLQEHPEATYNTCNCPYLRPAYLVDRALHYCSRDVAEGKLEQQGVSREINSEQQIGPLWNHIFHNVLMPLEIQEFFIVNVESVVTQFREMFLSSEMKPLDSALFDIKDLTIKQDPQYGRYGSSIDFELALQIFNVETNVPKADKVEAACSSLRCRLIELNDQKMEEVKGHLVSATDGTIGTVRYERLAADGPQIKAVTAEQPLATLYFTHYGPDTNILSDESLMFSDKGRYLMAHNGYIIGQDVRKNFAAEGSLVYLRRELVAWGDSVKLRFGDSPSDSPFLWSFMRKYCEEMARHFHGLRLDNCHSTPLHVAEYMLDAVRKVRPDSYVIAELFTNSEGTDNIFVNRLGINSMIREAMSAPNAHELGRLVYLYGGSPVGAFMLPPVRPLVPSIAHAILMDCTHDNKSPVETKSIYDILPSSALVSMACCATGSNRGYDELVPHHIHVVNEPRMYASFNQTGSAKGMVTRSSGVIHAKNVLNDLHRKLGNGGYSQVFVDQVSADVVAVTRHNPVTHESVVLISFTSFCPPGEIAKSYLKPLKVQGILESILFEMQIKSNGAGDEWKRVPDGFSKDSDFINGFVGLEVTVNENLTSVESKFARMESSSEEASLFMTENFRPGCIVAFKFKLDLEAQAAVEGIRSTLGKFEYLPRLNEIQITDDSLKSSLDGLDLVDLNRCLYHCNEEEEDEGLGGGVYNVTGYKSFVYCGLQGMESMLLPIRVSNDLGHPLCSNIREGNWLLDYTCNRLTAVESTKPIGLWLLKSFKEVQKIPRYLIPSYFDAVVNKLYLALINKSWHLMSDFIRNGSLFTKYLGLCSVQFVSDVPSASLPALSDNLDLPKPKSGADGRQKAPTIAAGLPHFCRGYMRNWGRDTFIALPGNLLIPGRYDEARWIILAFGGTMRHGLIPNLLDGGKKARFNCRDAIWFWMMAIQKYVEMVPNGHTILQDKVHRLYPKDDSVAEDGTQIDQDLEFVIQEAMTKHFQVLMFRERNAGIQIDEQMSFRGFNNIIGVDLDTGFPFGGNEWNCGTWMDKMGSSEKAGNKGHPATPRDGSAVEIVGLCKAAVSFLHQMYVEKKFSYQGVQKKDKDGSEIIWSYRFWAEQIKNNFEKCFHIPKTPSQSERRPDLVNRKPIYKDSYKASHHWPDYQLRCNFPIALAVAPELVDPQSGLEALEVAEGVLLGPLGIKTLAPGDQRYRPNYDNGNDSDDYMVARGFNYHMGPEWVWPVGFLLRAKLALAKRLGDAEILSLTKLSVKNRLSRHFQHLVEDEWRSLPELTNGLGVHCPDSNPAQSWSTGCILEVLWDLNQLK